MILSTTTAHLTHPSNLIKTKNYEHTHTAGGKKKDLIQRLRDNLGSSQQDTKQRSPSPPPPPRPPRTLSDDTKVDDAPEIETKSTKPALKRLVSAPTTEGSKISDAILEQIVNCLNEMNMESEFPCTPNVAACYAMFYLHVVGGYPYEDLTVDDVVNWFFGNGKDKDKTNWASGLPNGFKRVKDGYIVSSTGNRSVSPVHEKHVGDNRVLRVIAPTIRDWWWMQTYIRWPYDLPYETMHMNVSASQLDRT